MLNEYQKHNGRTHWRRQYHETYVGYNKPKRPTTLKDVVEWLNNNWTYDAGVWAGSPEGEMGRGYHSARKMAYLWYWEDQTGIEFPRNQ